LVSGSRRRPALIGLCVAAVFLVPAAQASADTTANTDDANISTPTGWWSYTNVSADQITSYIRANNARLTDIEPYNGSATRWTVTMVQNTGAYAVPSWWWYYGLTGAQVTQYLTTNHARLIHVQPYVVNGATRFAVIMVNNTGAQAREWYWGYGKSAANITNHISAKGTRLLDLETYYVNGNKLYAFISVKNSGGDADAWYWWLNQSSASLATKLKDTNSRLVDLERLPNGDYNAVAVKNVGADAAGWWWYINKPSLSGVVDLANQLGARPIDVETYTVNGERRYAAVFIDNSNADTRRVRNQYGQYFNDSSGNPIGIYEAYLESMTQGPLVTLNQNKATEVASTLKVLHLLHAMRQVAAGTDSLDVADQNVFYYGTGSVNNANNVCPTSPFEDPGDPHDTLTLRDTLQRMIRSSNNAATRAVVLRYRTSPTPPQEFSVFNNTAAWAGMESTKLRADIGCGLQNGGNLTTADDLATAYEDVMKGTVLDAPTRTEFWSIYGNGKLGSNTGELSNAITAVIDSEDSSLTAAQKAAFKDQVRFYAKRGGYGVCQPNSNPCQRWTIRTYSGRVSLPFKGPSGTVMHDYSFGSIVGNIPTSCWQCSEDAAVVTNAINSTAEIFRTQITQAISTW
jgi:hypothetical protein